MYQQYFHQHGKILIFFGINRKLRDLSLKYNFEFIDHQEITTKFSWNDSIHLSDTYQPILGQNFLNRVSNSFCKNDSFLTNPDFQETIRKFLRLQLNGLVRLWKTDLF